MVPIWLYFSLWLVVALIAGLIIGPILRWRSEEIEPAAAPEAERSKARASSAHETADAQPQSDGPQAGATTPHA